MIILSTLNARYAHASIGLRYLLANMAELQEKTEIIEFVIGENTQIIAEKILAKNPKIIGLSVYIWNVLEIKDLVHVLKRIDPSLKIVLGGPEASHLPHRVDLSEADLIVQGEGDEIFIEICRKYLAGEVYDKQLIKAPNVNLSTITLPYSLYTDHDIAHRHIYVEASRGCPFTCEFCLSSADNKVRNFNLDLLMEEFETLWQRGARQFKFIDRTFNLNIQIANRILDFFLSKEAPYFAHFEMVPGQFPDSLKERVKLFPPGCLQFEIGIQTLNTEVSDNIKRKLFWDKIEKNLRFLETETTAHMHVDLIIGLPGETIESFAQNLNTLCSVVTSEIQLGILKKLSGTTLDRHDQEFGMVYSDIPPYDILKNKMISFEEMQQMKRFARFWDLFYNNGNFKKSITLLWENGEYFYTFLDFCEWIYAQNQTTYNYSLQRLAEILFEWLVQNKGLLADDVAILLMQDLLKVEGRKLPKFLHPYSHLLPEFDKVTQTSANKRQAKRL
jgi:hypothetical protein